MHFHSDFVSTDYSKWREPSGDDICTLYMDCPDGQRLNLRVKLDEPLHYVKKQIAHKSDGKFPEKEQKLRFNGNVLVDDNATLKSIGVTDGDSMQMSCGKIKLFVEKKDGIFPFAFCSIFFVQFLSVIFKPFSDGNSGGVFQCDFNEFILCHIFWSETGSKVVVSVDPFDSISALKTELERKGLRTAKEHKVFKTKQRGKVPNNELLDDGRALMDYGLKEGDTVFLGGPTVWRPPSGDDAYPVFVDCPDGKTLTLNVTSNDDVGYTKLQIETLTKRQYPVNAQILKFKSKELDDDDIKLSDLGISKNATLQMSMGSIPVFVETREGKVLSLNVDPHDTG